jgi:hypothetical protein
MGHHSDTLSMTRSLQVEQGSEPTVDALLAELAQLSRQYQEIVAPYQAQMTTIEVAREAATAAITFQMQTLESLLRPLILAAKETRKVPYLTAIYQQRDKWDRAILFNIAQEVPAVMTAHEDASFVQFRKTAH